MAAAVWNQLIADIHASLRQAVLAVTGGGSGAIGRLLEVPGGSATLLEAVVPYASTALADWLGQTAEQACSSSTARVMAMTAWMRARELAPEIDPGELLGISATASLVSDRPKRGQHRIHVGMQSATHTSTYSLVLVKDKRDRLTEENLAAQLILLALAEACGVKTLGAQGDLQNQLQSDEQVDISQRSAESEWTELLLGQREAVVYPVKFAPQIIFPGAFNPLHAGHRQLANFATDRLGRPVAFEISITNVDKSPLDFFEITERVDLLRATFDDTAGSHGLLLTDAPTFRAKAKLFPGSTFLVGADTISRIADPKYYQGPANSFAAAIQLIADQGCRFLVFGRELEGRFQTLSQLGLPPALRELCEEVTAEEFREDVSSTDLRGR